jgi:O-antigen/teichoic acid export membrane protein
MKISRIALVKGVGWTVGAYGLTQLVRFATSIALTRILAPELFGTMVIVNSLRTGIDLLLDVGIGQNVIQNKNGDHPHFYNTAWTIQIIRGLFVWIICLIVAVPLAGLYEAPLLATLLPIAGLYFIFNGVSSVAPFLLRRRLQLAKLNSFEIIVTLIWATVQLVVAYLYPNIWALVFGGISYAALTMIGSFYLLRDLKLRIQFSKRYGLEILSFGKWIFLTSVIYFLSTNFDRLSLGKQIPLGLLGVYGIARSTSDLVTLLFMRLCDFVIFPLVASAAEVSRFALREKVAVTRFWLLLFVAFGISVFSVTSDLIIRTLLDARYQAAGLLLPIFSLGVWFSIVCSINESTLLGLGKPLYGAAANGLKLIYLIVGLPTSFTYFGIVGVATLVALSDLCRYLPILVGQVRERFSFGMQDLFLTVVLFGFVGCGEWLRWKLGFATSFEGLLQLRMTGTL